MDNNQYSYLVEFARSLGIAEERIYQGNPEFSKPLFNAQRVAQESLFINFEDYRRELWYTGCHNSIETLLMIFERFAENEDPRCLKFLAKAQVYSEFVNEQMDGLIDIQADVDYITSIYEKSRT